MPDATDVASFYTQLVGTHVVVVVVVVSVGYE